MSADKDNIYIDVDDEITNIIDKVTSSKHKIVALVLPKRATVLQSAINMKLLKRSVDSAKKNIVLITSEAGLMPLAGAAGLHVAKNLQSKPEIPAGPDTSDIPEALVNEEELETGDEEPELDNAKSVGELSGQPASSLPPAEEAIELDDDEPAEAAAAGAGAVAAKKKSGKSKDKKLKVPNFERFRKWFILGGIGLIILVVGGYFAFFALPKASIVIKTDTSNLNTNLTFTADTANKTFDEANQTIPAQKATSNKVDTQSVPATGQKNIGTQAKGTIVMTSNSCGLFSTADPVPQGSGVSSGGHTYITQEDASFSHGSCQSKSIDIVAQSPGVDYNTSSSASFTVAGRPDVTGSGSASGGTDNVVTVVSQADIDGAKAKFTAPSKSDAQSALSTQLQKDGLMPIDTSFNASDQNIATSAKVGDQVSSFTATSTINYSMLGVNKANLKTYLDDQIKGQINTGQQTIQDDGLSQATFSVVGTGDSPKVTIQTSATIGPNLDTDAIKRDIAGKKKGDTISIIEQRPSIKGVTVNYSPFWVTKTPSKASKVIITFQKADGK